jgi:hypothetical protein
MNKSELDRLAVEMMSQIDVASEEVIADERQVHLLDNDADVQIADYEPVYADELANSTDEVDLDRAQDELNERPDEVVGYRGGDNVRGGHERSPFRDDFVDALHQQAKAGIGPNGEILDEFDQRFQMQRGEHEALVQEAPFVRVNPVSSLVGTLGGQIDIAVGDDAKTVAYWVGNNVESTAVGVTFFPVKQVGALISRVRPIGIVIFGTRGFSGTIEVDILAGCQFMVTGSQVTLQVKLDQVGSSLIAMTLAGMLSFSTVMKQSTITRTIYVPDVGASGLQKITVPYFAKKVSLWRGGTANINAVQLQFQDANQAVVYVVDLAAGATMLVPAPIAGDIVYVSVSDTSGLGQTNVRVIFELSL